MVIKRTAICAAVALLAIATGPTARADYSNTVASFNPVAYWPLNENVVPPSNVATNLGTLGVSGNGFYGGGYTNGITGALVAGANTASTFDGASGHITVPFTTNLTLNAFSVEFWANPSVAAAGLTAVVSCGHLGDPRSGWLVYQDVGGFNLRMYNHNGLSTAVNIEGGGQPPVGTWTHFVATYDGTNANIYANGVNVGTANNVVGFFPNTDGPLTIGGRSDGGFNFNGSVDEVAVYTNVLTPTQILAHYQNGINPSPSQTYSSLVLASQPLVYHRLDLPVAGPSPIAVNRGSLGAVANGSYLPGTKPGVAGPTFTGFGPSNFACAFDPDAGGYVNCGTDPGLNLTGPMTVFAWIKGAPADSRFQSFVGISDASWRADVDQDGRAHFAVGSNPDSVGLRNVNDGLWHHFAGVYDGSTIAVYIDGTIDGLISAPTAPPGGTPPCVIGAAGDYLTSRIYKGTVAHVALIASALTSNNVLQVYYAANIPPSITVAPVSTNASQGGTTSFSVTAVGSPTLAYQWRRSGTNLIGQSLSTLTFPNVQPTDVGNYTVVVTNSYGSVTSSVAALGILTAPTIVSQPQSVTRFAGSNATFTVVAGGAIPLSYQWKFNGSPIGGATTSSFTTNNVQAINAGNYSVTVTNFLGQITSSNAFLVVLPTPTNGSYAATILADNPIAYWRLSETSGTVATDIVDGHNGTYSNVVLGVPGYANPYDSETAVAFGPGINSFVGGIQGIDFATGNATATFTLEAWVKGGLQGGDNGIIARGFGAGGEQYVVDTGAGNHAFRFGVRDTSNNFQGANSTTTTDGTWQHIVAVCNEPSGTLTLYVNGNPVGNGAAIAGIKTVAAGTPTTIGSRQSGANKPYDLNFNGTIDEVAIYNTALDFGQVQAHYNAHFAADTPGLVSVPPASTTNYIGGTSKFTVVGAGAPPLSYQWKHNGTDITGATDSTLTVGPLVSGDAGPYSVGVSNSFGGSVSSSAILTLLPMPTAVDLSSNLVLHLKFDGDYIDYSGRGNNGTNVGATTFVPGIIGSNAVHYSTDPNISSYNYIRLGLRPDLQFSSNVNFSVAYWIRYPIGEVQAGDLPIIGNAGNSTYNFGYCFSQNNASWLWTISDNSTLVDSQGPDNLLFDGSWHHLAHTFDRNGAAIDYVDGVAMALRGTGGVGNLNSGNPTIIGQDPTGVYGSQNSADLDDVGMWRRILTPLEVSAMYVAGKNSGVSFASAPVRLTIQNTGSQVIVSWPAGLLESSDNVTGPYTPVTGASSPLVVAPTVAKKFYRVKL